MRKSLARWTQFDEKDSEKESWICYNREAQKAERQIQIIKQMIQLLSSGTDCELLRRSDYEYSL